MKIYRHWARAEKSILDGNGRRTISCYGGSNVCLEDAEQNARSRLAQIESRLAEGHGFDRYGYNQGQLREPVIEELRLAGQTVAFITRNSYGAQVLNTAAVMFADIDLPQVDHKPVAISVCTRLMSLVPGFQKRTGRAEGPVAEPLAEPALGPLHKIRDVSKRHPELGIRVYRTSAGYRCLVTSRTWQPNQEDSVQMLTALDCDPLYIRLCSSQECFRARLTAKPWRIGLENPPCKIRAPGTPRVDLASWLAHYEAIGQQYSVCHFVESLGNTDVDAIVRPVLELHDMMCVGDQQLA